MLFRSGKTNSEISTKAGRTNADISTKAGRTNADITTKAGQNIADIRKELTKKKDALPVTIVKGHRVDGTPEETRCSAPTKKEAVPEPKRKNRITKLFKRKESVNSTGNSTAGAQKGVRRGFLGFRSAAIE